MQDALQREEDANNKKSAKKANAAVDDNILAQPCPLEIYTCVQENI